MSKTVTLDKEKIWTNWFMTAIKYFLD